MPEPTEPPPDCVCDECLVASALGYVENKPRRPKVVGADWNPHDGTWRERLKW
jgi:hypothetical protein